MSEAKADDPGNESSKDPAKGAKYHKSSSDLMERQGQHLVDAERMKAEMYKHLGEKEYDVSAYYWQDGFFSRIAKDDRFSYMTLSVISANAIWIGVCTDRNPEPVLSDAEPIFQVGEHFFCIFFTAEILVRFLAFESKINCLRDFWFKFDSLLVTLMILETWMLPLIIDTGGGGMSDASILRLLRLLRLSRMARLMKAVPELVILLKGMAVATRSVGSTLVLLILFLYVFAIIFKQQAEGNEVLQEYFSTIGESMWTLLIYGAFMDEISSVAEIIKTESALLTALLLVFVLISAFTVLNMLIGVLCEVVSAVAANEKEEIIVRFVKQQLLDVLVRLDHDMNGTITEDQFADFVNHKDCSVAFSELGVDKENLLALKDVIFAGDDDGNCTRPTTPTVPAGPNPDSEYALPDTPSGSTFPTKRASVLQLQVADAKELTFGEAIQVILNLRSSNTAMVKDIVELQKSMRKNQEKTAFAHEVLGQGQEEIIDLLRTLSEDVKEVKLKQERLERLVLPSSDFDFPGRGAPQATDPRRQDGNSNEISSSSSRPSGKEVVEKTALLEPPLLQAQTAERLGVSSQGRVQSRTCAFVDPCCRTDVIEVHNVQDVRADAEHTQDGHAEELQRTLMAAHAS